MLRNKGQGTNDAKFPDLQEGDELKTRPRDRRAYVSAITTRATEASIFMLSFL